MKLAKKLGPWIPHFVTWLTIIFGTGIYWQWQKLNIEKQKVAVEQRLNNETTRIENEKLKIEKEKVQLEREKAEMDKLVRKMELQEGILGFDDKALELLPKIRELSAEYTKARDSAIKEYGRATGPEFNEKKSELTLLVHSLNELEKTMAVLQGRKPGKVVIDPSVKDREIILDYVPPTAPVGLTVGPVKIE